MSGHKELVCCVAGCGGLICLTPEQEKKLRRTHEYFRCPFGHDQHFAGETEEERTIRELRDSVSRLELSVSWRDERIAALADERDRALAQLRTERGNKTKLRKRIAALTEVAL